MQTFTLAIIYDWSMNLKKSTCSYCTSKTVRIGTKESGELSCQQESARNFSVACGGDRIRTTI